MNVIVTAYDTEKIKSVMAFVGLERFSEAIKEQELLVLGKSFKSNECTLSQ